MFWLLLVFINTFLSSILQPYHQSSSQKERSVKYKMEMGMLFCSVVLFVMLLAYVDARLEVEPKFMDEGNKLSSIEGRSPNSICNSCLEASREAEKTLGDLKLFGYVDMLLSEVCHILPSDLKAKCLQKSEAYMHQTMLSLQDLFHEENLCKSTGLCLDESMLPIDNSLISLNKFSPETEEKTCSACRKAVKNLFIQLKTPKMRMKIMETLIEHCKETDQNGKQCKQNVYTYVPLILSKLDKLKTSDLCRLMNLCDEGISL